MNQGRAGLPLLPQFNTYYIRIQGRYQLKSGGYYGEDYISH
nr:MAG TPA: hypothetical protein [Caudoviricetes sp.]